MVTAIPSLIVGLLAGVYVDRHDRKKILMYTCLIQAVIVGVHRVRDRHRVDRVAGLYALLLLNAGVKQFFDPAHDSLIPEIASDEELAAANSFLSIAVVRLDGDRVRRRRPARRHGRPAPGVHPRRGHVPRLRRCSSP